MNDLQGMTVLVTRPEPQGSELCAEITAHHGNAVYLPTIEIIAEADAAVAKQIAELDSFDMIIFVSAHAVRQGLHLIQTQWQEWPARCKIAAVGASTARALLEANLSVTLYPVKNWSSRGLLDLPEMQSVSGQRIAIVCGADGRTLLADTLRERGAHVENFIVYRRAIPRVNNLASYVELFKAKKIDIIVCTSATSLLHLIEMIGAENSALLHRTVLVVVSERLVALAEELHFKHVFLADNASHNNVIEALGTIRNLLGKIYGGQ